MSLQKMKYFDLVEKWFTKMLKWISTDWLIYLHHVSHEPSLENLLFNSIQIQVRQVKHQVQSFSNYDARDEHRQA